MKYLPLLTLLFVTGCNQQSLTVRDSDSFKSAPPEIKTIWQTAVAAAKTNGYLTAYNNLQTLQTNSSLTAEQTKAVTELLGVVGTRMFKAANDGDPEATKAVKEVQATTRRH